MTDRRDWIDVIDAPVILGVLSTLPFGYFWFCMLAHTLGMRCPGSTEAMLLWLFLAVPMSVAAGAYGCRLWWSTTAITVGTWIFIFWRWH